jgi:pseudouridine synthase
MRLNKYLASAGICSRRQADTYIEAGRIRLNGKTITKLGTTIDAETDQIEVDGKPVKLNANHVVYILNKPKGVVTTADDPEKRKTVLDFVPRFPRVFPCGRLDVNTQGLIVLTNDGTLCYQLTHPKFEHEKEYLIHGNTKTPKAAFEILKNGVVLPDGPVTVHKLELLKASGNQIELLIAVHEGRNHLVRRMCAKAGIEVTNLTRTKLGKYELGDLGPGKYRTITEK